MEFSAVLFCTLALLGDGLFALVAITNATWYYPTLFYGVVVCIAWQRYFSVSFKIEQTASAAATPTVSQATKADSAAFQSPTEADTQAARQAEDQELPE